MKTNEELYNEALEAARRLFEDTSVDKEVTIAQLDALMGEIYAWYESLMS